jgi:hypothetical protein
MMLAKTFILTCVAALAAGLNIPRSLPNGLYKIYFDAQGEPVYESVDSVPQSTIKQENVNSSVESRSLMKRGQTWCGCNRGSKSWSHITRAYRFDKLPI